MRSGQAIVCFSISILLTHLSRRSYWRLLKRAPMFAETAESRVSLGSIIGCGSVHSINSQNIDFSLFSTFFPSNMYISSDPFFFFKLGAIIFSHRKSMTSPISLLCCDVLCRPETAIKGLPSTIFVDRIESDSMPSRNLDSKSERVHPS